MNRKNTLLGVAMFYCLNLASQTIDFTLHFDKGSDKLLQSEQRELEIWASSHLHFKHEPLLLRGHTDEDADSKFNIDLSARRNQTVFTLLKMYGFSDIKYEDFGESWPICQAKDEVCMSQNRRVEILLLEDEKEKWARALLDNIPQVNFIPTDKDNYIEGKEGTLVSIPAKTLVNAKGEVAENARIELREFYDFKSCIKYNISTQYKDQILESGGMIELRAYDTETGEELRPLNTESVAVSFRDNAEQKEGMRLFYGTIENGVMNWGDTPTLPVASATSGNWQSQLATRNIDASEGSLVVFSDSRIGYVTILVNSKNREQVKRIMNKTERQRTNADIEMIKKWKEETDALERKNEIEYQRQVAQKMRADSLENAKKIAAFNALSKKQQREFLKKQEELQKKEKEKREMEERLQRVEMAATISGMGFINCDRFISNPQVLVNLSIESSGGGCVYFIFKNRNGIMTNYYAESTSGKTELKRSLPRNETIQIITRASVNGELYVAYQEFITNDSQEIRISPKPSTEKEYQALLEKHTKKF
jgi:flagellar motor protein MotB